MGAQFLFQAALGPTWKVFMDLTAGMDALDPESSTYAADVQDLMDAALLASADTDPAYDYLGLFTGLSFDLETGALTGDFDASACSVTYEGGASNDAVHHFTAPTAGDYTFELVQGQTDYDSILYVLDGPTCDAANACLGYDDILDDGGESVTVTLTAGQNVFVVVDGWSNSSNISGSYVLGVTGP